MPLKKYLGLGLSAKRCKNQAQYVFFNEEMRSHFFIWCMP
jgi:hypothetical protein